MLILSINAARSQSRLMDSVRILMNAAKDDRTKLPQLKQMCYYHSSASNLDSSIYFGEQGISIATNLNLKKALILS